MRRAGKRGKEKDRPSRWAEELLEPDINWDKGPSENDPLWLVFHESNASNSAATLARYVDALAYFLMRNQDLKIEWIGETEEEIQDRWDSLIRVIKRALLRRSDQKGDTKDGGGGKGKGKRNTPKVKKLEDNDDEKLMKAALRLITALCLLLKAYVPEMMIGDDKNSVSVILSKFLKAGYQRKEKGRHQKDQEDTAGSHSSALHREALNTFGFVVFCSRSPHTAAAFLQAASQYFALEDDQSAADADDEPLKESPGVLADCITLWTFLLSTMEDDQINEVLEFKVLKPVAGYLFGDSIPAKLRMAAGYLLYAVISLETEYPDLDMIGYAKEDIVDRFRELSKVSTDPKEAKGFRKLLAKVQNTQDHDRWIVYKSTKVWGFCCGTDVPNKFKLNGWQIDVQWRFCSKFLGEAMGQALLRNTFLQSELLNMATLDEDSWGDHDGHQHMERVVVVRKVKRTELQGAKLATKGYRRRIHKGPNYLNQCRWVSMDSRRMRNWDIADKERNWARNIRRHMDEFMDDPKSKLT